jgi:DNA-binding GntR family transcriptional regulator
MFCNRMSSTDQPEPVFERSDGLAAAAARRGTEFAYEHLRQLILAGDLGAGSSLSQVQLARQIGVSRTPLREAVRRLQADGLLRAEVNQRVRVAEAPLAELDDLYALRIVTEAIAVRMTVEAMSDDDIRELRAALERLEAAEGGPRAAFDVCHRDLHMRLVAGAAGRLRATIDDSWDHAERYRRLYAVSLGDSGVQQAHREHHAIVDAVQARDAARVAVLLAHHYARVALVLIAHHQPGLDTSAIRCALALAAPEDGRRPPLSPPRPEEAP